MILEHFAAFLHNTASEPHTATSVSAVRLPQTETATAFFLAVLPQPLKKCGISWVFPTFEKADCTLGKVPKKNGFIWDFVPNYG